MALLGTVAATSTQVLTLDFVPEQLAIQTAAGVSAFSDITSITVVNKGRQLVTLTGSRIRAMARIGSFINGAAQVLAELLPLGAGRLSGSTTITIANGGANPLQIFGFSTRFSNVGSNFVETSINANANQSFEGFQALALSTPANVARVNITFADNFNDDFTPQELHEILGNQQNTDANGELDGNIVLRSDFAGQEIQRATVFVNGSGACVVGVWRLLEL